MKRMVGNTPLTSQNILRDFGDRAAVARECVSTLFDALGADDAWAVAPWSVWFGRWAGRAIEKIPQSLARLAARYGVANDQTRLLFALQTYYALVVRLLAERYSPKGTVPFSSNENWDSPQTIGNPFDWCDAARSKAVGRIIERWTILCEDYSLEPVSNEDDGECDLFKPLYQNLFPRALRHQLGEYYTPDWLADHVLDQVGYHGQPGCRLLDPACGSGTFLLLALRRFLRGEVRGERGGGGKKAKDGKLSTIHYPLSTIPIVGFDLNPLAVLTARANWAITLARLLSEHEPAPPPIFLYDSILGRGEAQGNDAEGFDFVVGNPPWIAWDNLADEDRQATKPLWERYGLFSLTGNEARHGGGKKDLSMLMLYTATDRYLKPAGRLGMVVSQSLFQTKGAGDGFRRFRLGDAGPPLRVLRVDDMVALRPFDAMTRTSVIVLEKDAETEYPVAYYRWTGEAVASGQWLVASEGTTGKASGTRAEEEERGEGNHKSQKIVDAKNPPSALRPPPSSSPSSNPQSPIPNPFVRCLARPIDPARPTSPWMVEEREKCEKGVKGEKGEKGVKGVKSDYTAHLGANSGGANGVYWVELFGPCDGNFFPSPFGREAVGEGCVLVRNLAAVGKNSVESVEAIVEPDLLYPLLRWGDIGRFHATLRAFLLLAQDPATRRGIDESVMRAKYPLTLAYLERFRPLLERRAAYRRYQQGGPFYAMYNVGPYTVAPIKVVWRRMDRRINAAVVEAATEDCPNFRVSENGTVPFRTTPRAIIPQETCVLTACETSDEAHYLCAMLNSEAVNRRAAAHAMTGAKSFGTPGMFDYLPLRRFQPDDVRHAELSQLSRQAHVCDETASMADLQGSIDELAEGVWGGF